MPSPVTTRPSSPSLSQLETPVTPPPHGEAGRTGRTPSPPPEVDRNASVTGGLTRRSSLPAQQRRPVTQSALPATTAGANVGSGSPVRGSSDAQTSTAVTAEQLEEARQGMLAAMARVPGEGKEMAFIRALFNAPVAETEGSGDVDGSKGPATLSVKGNGKEVDTGASGSMQPAQMSTDNPLAGMGLRDPGKMTSESILKTAATTIGTLEIDVPPEERKAAEKGGTLINDFVVTGNVPSGATSEPQIGGTENELAIERLSEEVISRAASLVGQCQPRRAKCGDQRHHGAADVPGLQHRQGLPGTRCRERFRVRGGEGSCIGGQCGRP